MPSTSSRSVRIFLSSTFRDFGEERDLLVRKVFPGLRAKLKDRFVELVDVDLRWGITAEEAERGEVLPICLAEIDRARPYFVGMLGDRYGWIPESNKYLTDLLERQPWLAEHRGGKSVTELEILHGVLNDPQMAGRAFFYFRSSDYAKAKGGDYVAASAEDASRQAHLKDRVRKSGFPVVEDYPSPEVFAERLENDLWQVLDEAFPADEVPDGFERESRKHEAYALPRRRLYLGGESYASTLTEYLDGKQQRVLIEGQSGSGKSALIANWIESYRKTHPDLVVHEHYLAASADAADPASLVRRLIEQIKRVTGSSDEIPGDPHKLYESLSLWLANASAWGVKEGRDWVFVIDALNNLTDLHNLRFFPELLPEHIHFVISCLPGEVHESLLAKGEWARLVVEPLNFEESRTLLREYLKRYNKTLPPELETKALSHPLATNPLFLRTLAEELRLFGRHEDLANRLNHYLTSKTIDDLFERVLERVEGDCGEKAVRKTLTAIWASRSGLSEMEIMGIANLKPLEWAPIRFALDDMLLDINGRLSFAHDYMKIAVSDRYLHGNNALQNEGQSEDALNARCALHAQLAQWFEDQFKANTKAKEDAGSKSKPVQEAQSDRETGAENIARNTADSNVTNDISTSKAATQNKFNLKADDTIEASDNDNNAVVTADKGADKGADALKSDIEPKTLYDHEAVHEALVTDERAAEEVPYQWQQTEDWQRLKDCLTTRTMFEAVYNNRGEQELLAYWLDLENNMEANIEREYEVVWDIWKIDETKEETGNLAIILSSFFIFAGRKNNFVIYLQKLAIKIYESFYGYKSKEVILLYANLANFMSIKNLEEASRIFIDIIDHFEKQFGFYSFEYAVLMCNFASLEHGMGNYKSAKIKYEKSIKIFSKLYGKNNFYLASAYNNIAILFHDNVDFKNAEKYYKLALQIIINLKGIRHYTVAIHLNNLALLMHDKGNFYEAEKNYREALEIAEKTLGFDHSETGFIINNYAALVHCKGDLFNAEILNFQSLNIAKKIEPNAGYFTLKSLNNLGCVLQDKGDFKQAIKFYLRSVNIAKRLFGKQHLLTGRSINNLASIFERLEKYEFSSRLYKIALQIIGDVQGKWHPEYGTILNNLAGLLQSNNQLCEAEKMYDEALNITKKALGIDHPETLTILANLASNMQKKGELTKAENIYLQVLQKRKNALGATHIETTNVLYALANIYLIKKDYKLAEKYIRNEIQFIKKSSYKNIDSLTKSYQLLSEIIQNKAD